MTSAEIWALACTAAAAALGAWPAPALAPARRLRAIRDVWRGMESAVGRTTQRSILAALAAGAAALGALVSLPVAVAGGLAAVTAGGLVMRAARAARTESVLARSAAMLHRTVRELDAGRNLDGAVRAARAHSDGDAGGDRDGSPWGDGREQLRGPMKDAIDRVADALTGPTGDESDISPGPGGQPDPLRNLVTRLRAARVLSARHGVGLAVLLRYAADDIEATVEAGRDCAVETAGPRMSGYVLAALPIAGIALGSSMGVDPIDALTGTTWGGALLVIGVALACGGLWWIDAMVRR